MAADLRVKLFDHLLQMPMTFFDQRKVSDLSERLNFDVQEFKSSFKLCVSQGLRTLTQVRDRYLSEQGSSIIGRWLFRGRCER